MKLHLYALFLLVSSLNQISGQDYFFRQYKSEEGLNHSYVYAVSQGEDGYLWIGTAEGLYRFNGFEFSAFTTADGLADNLISVLFTDSRGTLWIGHRNGAVTRLNRSGFAALNDTTDQAGAVTDIIEDDQGSIWITKQSLGLLHIGQDGGITRVHFPEESASLTQIASLGNDQFLIGSQENLYLSKFERTSASMTDLERLDYFPLSKVAEILPESDSSYIIISETHGFYGFQTKGSPREFNFSIIEDNADGQLDNLQGGLIDAYGHLWLYSLGQGMIRYTQDPDGAYIRNTIYSSQNGLASDNVRTLFEDAEGNLWLGMYGEGLLKYSTQKLGFYHFAKDGRRKLVNAIATREGRLLLVSGQHLLEISETGDSIFFVYSLPLKSNEDKVNTAYVSEDGKLWLGLEKSGLYVSDTPGYSFRSVFLSRDDLANSVNHLTGSGKYLWVATKKGVCRIDRELGDQAWITSENRLPHNNIKQLFIDSKGRVLVATLCSEVHYITESLEVAVLENSQIGPNNKLVSILEGVDGSIWAGTEGNGLWKIGKDRNLNFNRFSGLYSDYCYSLALSSDGGLVIGHRGGLSQMGAKSKRIRFYDRLSGISTGTEFFTNVVLGDQAGNLWFGTSEGLVRLASGSARADEIAPWLHIDGVYLNGEKIDHKAGSIQLKPGQYELQVDYIGLHYSNPEMVSYQSRLDGFSTDWSEPTLDRKVVYEHLEHGDYSFHLRAFNENDVRSEASSLFEIWIKKPVYLRIWFYGVLLLLLSVSFYVIIRIREKNLRKVQENLMKNLDEKTKEIIVKEEIIKERKKVEKVLIEAKAKAEQSEKLKTAFLQNISHEIRTPMNAIVGFSQLLREDTIAIEDRNKYSKNVSDNAESLLTLVDNIIDLSKLETDQLEFNPEPIPVNLVINKAEEFALKRMRKVGKEEIKLIKACPCEDTFEIETDFIRLKQVIIHLLDNAVKFTEKGKITYGYQLEEQEILFFVEDTGIGLSEDMKEVVFDLFRKVEDDHFKLYGGTGMGLTLARYLVSMLGGEINVDSIQEKGSRFYFKIPVHSGQVSELTLNKRSDES